MSVADTITDRPLTARGRETRRRIVEAASDLMVERGVAAVSLDEVGRVASTSKSQMCRSSRARTNSSLPSSSV